MLGLRVGKVRGLAVAENRPKCANRTKPCVRVIINCNWMITHFSLASAYFKYKSTCSISTYVDLSWNDMYFIIHFVITNYLFEITCNILYYCNRNFSFNQWYVIDFFERKIYNLFAQIEALIQNFEVLGNLFTFFWIRFFSFYVVILVLFK